MYGSMETSDITLASFVILKTLKSNIKDGIVAESLNSVAGTGT